MIDRFIGGWDEDPLWICLCKGGHYDLFQGRHEDIMILFLKYCGLYKLFLGEHESVILEYELIRNGWDLVIAVKLRICRIV